MSSSREDSPDWLRSYQPPNHSVVTLSSDSESSHRGQSPSVDDLPDLKKTVQSEFSLSPEEGKPDETQTSKKEISQQFIDPHLCSTIMPLVLPNKVQRSKVLVECEGDSIDMSGDMGAVGRVMISDSPLGHEMCLDLKGTMYKATVVPSRTFCVVNFGHSDAKIEAIMNDFMQLKPHSDVFHAETMVEGTLDGFSFDSEDEAERMVKLTTNDKDENYDSEQVNGKRKAKAEKNLGKVLKKGKTAGGKPQKKVRKKPQVAKKARNKK